MKNKKIDPEESLEKYKTDLSELCEIIGENMKKNEVKKPTKPKKEKK